MTTVVLKCVLLPDLEDIEHEPVVSASRLARNKVDVLQLAFIPQSYLDRLGISDIAVDLVSIENEAGDCVCLRPSPLDAEIFCMFQRQACHMSGSDHSHLDPAYFVVACSSARIFPGCLHSISKVAAPQSSSPVLIKSLTLARLVGQTYVCDKQEEDAALHTWFSTQARVVRPGDVTPVPRSYMGISHDSCTVSWYLVLALSVTGGAEDGGRVGGKGKVVEDSDARMFVSDPEATAVLLNECYMSARLANIELRVSPVIHMSPRCGALAATAHDAVGGRDRGGARHAAEATAQRGSLYADVVQAAPSFALRQHLQWCARLLLPSFGAPREQAGRPWSGAAPAYAAAVVQTMASCDVLAELDQFAEQQRVRLYHVDYRSFLYAAAHDAMTARSSTTRAPPVLDAALFRPALASSQTRHAPPSQLSSRPTLSTCFSSSRGAELEDDICLAEAVAPCVLCITDLDFFPDVEEAQGKELKRAADQRLCAFVHALFSRLAEGRGDSGGAPAVTLVGTTSSAVEQLSPEVLQHFPQHLSGLAATATLIPASSASRVGKEARLYESTCADNADFLGHLHMAHFVQELRLASLKRVHGRSWACEAFSFAPRPLPHVTSPDSMEMLQERDVARVQACSRRGWWGVRQTSGATLTSISQVLAGGDMPQVHWDDIGGVESVRRELLDTLLLANRCSLGALRPSSSRAPRRTGVLLYGPPGTGKTLIAKAVACECGMAFMSVKGPELLDMYIGESERRVRDLFSRARASQPCVLFFDELDSLAPARGGQSSGGGASSGVLDRVVSQLLIEMDDLADLPPRKLQQTAGSVNGGGEESAAPAGVFVIGATNRPDLLDTALMRPGRFDKKIFLGPCDSRESKIKVLSAQTKDHCLHGCRDAMLGRVAGLLHNQPTTGAELGALVSTAYESALARKIRHLEELSLLSRPRRRDEHRTDDRDDDSTHRVAEYIDDLDMNDDALSIEIMFSDFEEAIQVTKLSISSDDYAHYIK